MQRLSLLQHLHVVVPFFVLCTTTIMSLTTVSAASVEVNVLELDMLLSAPYSTATFATSQRTAFEAAVASAVRQRLTTQSALLAAYPPAVVALCDADFGGAKTAAASGALSPAGRVSGFISSGVSLPVLTTRQPTILCAVTAEVRAASLTQGSTNVAVFDAYSALRSLEVGDVNSSEFRTSLTWPVRSAVASVYDLPNADVSPLLLQLVAPCRGSALQQPATAAPGNAMACSSGSTTPSSVTFTFHYDLASSASASAASAMVCTSLTIAVGACSTYVTASVESSDQAAIVLTLRGQASPLAQLLQVVSIIRSNAASALAAAASSQTVTAPALRRVLLRPTTTSSSSTSPTTTASSSSSTAAVGVTLYDYDLEKPLITSTVVDCAAGDYLWLIGLVAALPVFYIIVWTSYRCGRRSGKEKMRAQLARAESDEASAQHLSASQVLAQQQAAMYQNVYGVAPPQQQPQLQITQQSQQPPLTAANISASAAGAGGASSQQQQQAMMAQQQAAAWAQWQQQQQLQQQLQQQQQFQQQRGASAGAPQQQSPQSPQQQQAKRPGSGGGNGNGNNTNNAMATSRGGSVNPQQGLTSAATSSSVGGGGGSQQHLRQLQQQHQQQQQQQQQQRNTSPSPATMRR